jgi:hypothetical protein
MSLPEQQVRAMCQAAEFLLDLSSGREKRIPSATRKRAREIAKHYPYAPEIEAYWRSDERT